MVRRKIEIKPLEAKSKRHTTFTKRRNGLMKKTREFCEISGSNAVMIAFSSAGNCYALGHPDVDAVLGRYDEGPPSASVAEPAARTEGGRLHADHGNEEAPPLKEVQKRIAEAIKTGRWEEAVRGLGTQELGELYAEVENVKRKAAAKITEAVAPVEKGSESSGGDSGC